MEKISVIMSVYNETETQLNKSILSIINQTFSNFEFIIILDNPNNIIAKNTILSFLKNDNRIIFFENEENK